MLRDLLFGFMALVVVAGTAMAQDAPQDLPQDAPLMGSEALPPPAAAPLGAVGRVDADLPPGFGGEDGVFRILMIGDSLAGGLGAGMTRMATGDPRFEIANRFNEFASIMRPQNYDWADAITKMTAVKPYDAAVILMGINDRQDWRNGNIRYAFGTPQWTEAYEQQLDRILDSVKAGGLKIYWVAMPPFGEPDFEADMQKLAALQKKHVEAKGGVVLDVRAALLGPDGTYTDRGLDEFGAERRIRESDGITFFKQGNNRFGILVLDALKAAEERSVPVQPLTPNTSGTPDVPSADQQAIIQPAKPDDAGTPLFGQQGIDGSEMSFDARSVPEPKPVAAVAAAGGAVKIPRPAKGSHSELLLEQGSVAESPSGRYDDFSYVEPSAAAN